MKKNLLSFFCTFVVLFLTVQHYYRDIVRISFDAQSNRITSVYAFFTQTPDESLNDFYIYQKADLTKKQTLTFKLPVRRLYGLRLAFNLNTTFSPEQKSIKIWPVLVEGKTRKILYPVSAGKKYTKIYNADASEVLFKTPADIESQKQFYFLPFLLIAAASFLSFRLILTYRTAALSAAAVAGYTAISFWYDISFSANNPFLGSILAAGIFLLYFKTYPDFKEKINIPLAFLSISFGILNFLSLGMYRMDSWALVINTPFLSAVSIAGLSLLFYTGGLYFNRMMFSGILFKMKNSPHPASKLLKFYNDHTVSAVFILILLCWLPWHIIYYPGMITLDSKNQIKQILGFYYKSQHHPVLATFLLGLCLKAGIFLKDNNLGVYFYTLLQSVICAWIFALCINCIRKMGAKPGIQAACLLFFILPPLAGSFTIWTIKDILFSGLFTLFVLQTILLINGPVRNKNLFFYGITFFLVCQLRKNGIYCTLPVFLAVIFFIVPPALKLRATVILTLWTAVFFILTKSVFPALGYREGGKEEMLAIPLQQTARYIRDYGQDILPQERTAIDKVLPFDTIASKYRPEFSDPVKNRYKLTDKETEMTDLADYFKTWLKLFFKHPISYFQAAMGNSYLYYSFTYFHPAVPARLWEGYDAKVYVNQAAKTFPLRQLFNQAYDAFWMLPFLFILYSCPLYTWLTLLICTFFISRRQLRPLIPLLPLVINILVCIASPVNGMFRYFLPIVTAMPLAFIFCAKQATDEKNTPGLSGEKK